MEKARSYFKNKKVTILGLGLLGKGLGDAIFLAQCGAHVTVTDLKSAKELASSVSKLKKFKNVHFVLGRHEYADFENADFVLKAQGVSLDSPYIAHARNNGVPIRMDDELFVFMAPKNVKIIGVTGTRGKTTTASLIYHILKVAGKRVHLGGNIRGVATLEILKKVKTGDIVVLELSSWQLQGFGEQKISPQIAVFTNFMPDHMNYYAGSMKDYFSDKALIYKYQKRGDVLVVGKDVAKKIKNTKAKKIVATSNMVPAKWKLPLAGEHNKENISFAVAVAKSLKIPETKIKKGVEGFKAVEGRLQLLKSLRGIGIYNDNNSTTPEATVAALKSFPKTSIILIMGGADKGLDTRELLKAIDKYASTVILLPGSGVDKLKVESLKSKVEYAKDLKGAVSKAVKVAQKGDIILFSPAFASFGMFVNEYDRNDQFMKLVKKLK